MIHQGHFSFIVSLLLSSCVFLFVLFISPFEGFGFSGVVQRGGTGGGGLPGGRLIIVCVCVTEHVWVLVCVIIFPFHRGK